MFHPKGPSLFELARQWLSSTEAGYGLLAPKVDCTPFRTPDPVLSVVEEQIYQLAPIGFLLDVCCGTGAAIHRLSSICHHSVGIDFSDGMLEVACSAARSSPADAHIAFLRGDALALPFRESFDMAVCFGAFGHILPHNEPQLIRQIADVLKPGGRFVFVTSEMPPKWSKVYWLSRGVNSVKHLRNWVVKPPFIMYYLTFLLPDVKDFWKTGALPSKCVSHSSSHWSVYDW